jgi:hypothetical protein
MAVRNAIRRYASFNASPAARKFVRDRQSVSLLALEFFCPLDGRICSQRLQSPHLVKDGRAYHSNSAGPRCSQGYVERVRTKKNN